MTNGNHARCCLEGPKLKVAGVCVHDLRQTSGGGLCQALLGSSRVEQRVVFLVFLRFFTYRMLSHQNIGSTAYPTHLEEGVVRIAWEDYS